MSFGITGWNDEDMCGNKKYISFDDGDHTLNIVLGGFSEGQT